MLIKENPDEFKISARMTSSEINLLKANKIMQASRSCNILIAANYIMTVELGSTYQLIPIDASFLSLHKFITVFCITRFF